MKKKQAPKFSKKVLKIYIKYIISRFSLEYRLFEVDDGDNICYSKEILEFFETSERYKDFKPLDVVFSCPEQDVVDVILELIPKCEFHQIIELTKLLKLLTNYNTFPYRLAQFTKTHKKNKDLLYTCLHIYSTLFYAGFTLHTTYEELLTELKVNRKELQEWLDVKLRDVMSLQQLYSNLNYLGDDYDDREYWNDKYDDYDDFDYHYEDNASLYQFNVYDKIKAIAPLNKEMEYSNSGLFYTKKKIRFPLESVLNDLENYYKDPILREKFLTPIEDFEDLVEDPSIKKLVRSIQKQMEKGNYSYLLKKFVRIEQAVSDNPVIYFMKAKILQASMESSYYKLPNYYKIFIVLEKLMEYAPSKPRIEYYLDIAFNLKLLGQFSTAYILTLKLLKFLPLDFQLNVIAGYCAYQLMRDYEIHLFRGSLIDPARMLNFLDEFWIKDRFKPMDSFKKLNFNEEKISKLMDDYNTAWNKLDFNQLRNGLNWELLGAKFPFESVIGINPPLDAFICNDECYDDSYADINGDSYAVINDDPYAVINDDPYADIDDDELNLFFTGKIHAVIHIVEDWFEKINSNWKASNEYKSLPKYTWRTRDNIPKMAVVLCYLHNGKFPSDWDWNDVENIALDYFPKFVNAPKYYFKSIGRVLEEFMNFLYKYRKKKYKNLKDFPEKIKEISKKIIEIAEKNENRKISPMIFDVKFNRL